MLHGIGCMPLEIAFN